jgi:hypothetical protein
LTSPTPFAPHDVVLLKWGETGAIGVRKWGIDVGKPLVLLKIETVSAICRQLFPNVKPSVIEDGTEEFSGPKLGFALNMRL